MARWNELSVEEKLDELLYANNQLTEAINGLSSRCDDAEMYIATLQEEIEELKKQMKVPEGD